MILAYADESGDNGYANSPTRAFVLAFVLVQEADWLPLLDRLRDMRRYLWNQYHISPNAELKAYDLMGPSGAFRRLGISAAERLDIYKLVMRFQAKTDGFTTFAIAIDKDKVKHRNQVDPRERCWRFALERLHSYAKEKDQYVKLFPDAGHGYFIRRMLRKMRRFHRVPAHYGSGTLSAEAQRIIEDPSDRNSHESYFIQLADLNAYAAHRYLWPTKRLGRDMWDALGDIRLTKVNDLVGGPPGIKVFPT